MDLRSCNLSGCAVSFLPIVSVFIRKIGVVEEVDKLQNGKFQSVMVMRINP
jgi:hypothetical protein